MTPPLEGFIRNIREIQTKFSRFYTRILNKAGLTQPQYALLLELVYASGPMPMTAVSQKLFITKPAVTNLADRLEKRGFLKRMAHPEDRRISLLEIQPKGRKIAESVRQRFLDIMLDTIKGFSAQERKAVEKFYSELSMTFDGMLCPKKGKCD